MTAPDLATPRYRVNGSEKSTAIWVEDTLTDKRFCTVTPGEDDADRAALIVRAVNSYAALVAALEAVVTIERNADDLIGTGMVDHPEAKAMRAMASKAKAALALARQS